MKTEITKQQIIETLKTKQSCITGFGLANGKTRWEMFKGAQRKYSQIIDGRIVNGLIRSGVLKQTLNGDFQTI
jgi:hypothetical protein